MIKIAEKFENLSKEIWKKIPAAHHHGIQYGEETITNSMLLDIVTQIFFNIQIIQTSKYLESTQGTDWEWYIGSDRYGWITFVIQAKKLHAESNNYKELDHYIKISRARQQILIRKYANRKKAIPLYNFYNHYKSVSPTHWQCAKPYDKELLGWTFTPLLNVEAVSSIPAGKKRRIAGWCSFNTIHSFNETLPIRCLFSCPYFINFYKDMSLIGKPGMFLGEPFVKNATLPAVIARKIKSSEQDLLSFTEAELDNYLNDDNRSLDNNNRNDDTRDNNGNFATSNFSYYPKRIAVIDIGDLN